MDALVRAVPAGGVAELAADALVFVDARDDLVVEVQVLPLRDVGQRAAAEVVECAEVFAAHPCEQCVGHVFDDAIAVVHGRGADLHGARAEEDELGGVLPGGDAADGAHRKRGFGIGHDLLDHIERDGLDCGTAIAAVRRLAVDVRARLEGVEVDAGDGVDGVDGGECVGTGAFGGARGHADVGDVGCELDDDRSARGFLHPFGDLLAVFRHLTYGRAHAALAHAVWAAKVELEAVGAGALGTLDDVVPDVAFGFDHERSDDDVLRIAALYFFDLAEVDFDGAVADELDVVQAHHFLSVVVDGGVARADVGDGLSDGLPDGAAPACVEGAHDLLAAVGGRSGGEPEGVEALDAGEGGLEGWARHSLLPRSMQPLRCQRAYRQPRHRRPRGRRWCSRRLRSIWGWRSGQ